MKREGDGPAMQPNEPTVRALLEAREDASLAVAATRSADQPRAEEEPESDLRTRFQRDRDRVVHSKAFRRLMHKTQVFIAPTGDHYRTRLTHSLEVTQIARTIGRALRLNEDLIEAIGLAHDLGHTPFGHAGESALGEVFPGFRHNEQSLRVVEVLERDGRGLNLTDAVRDGILRHSKSRSGITGNASGRPGTLEGEVLKIADGIAYINHDIDDAIRAGIMDGNEIPLQVREVLGDRHSARIDTLVADIVTHSESDAVPGHISMSHGVREAADILRDFLYDRVYTPLNQEANTHRAQHIVRTLFQRYAEDPTQLPEEFRDRGRHESPERLAADYIASMTDRYAIDLYERLYVPQNWNG